MNEYKFQVLVLEAMYLYSYLTGEYSYSDHVCVLVLVIYVLETSLLWHNTELYADQAERTMTDMAITNITITSLSNIIDN